MRKIYLASKSPRRISLLNELRVAFETKPVAVQEISSDPFLGPAEIAMENATRKAQEAAQDLEEGLVIGVDTIVYVEGKALGKPRDRREARQMLTLLCGRTHEVYSGVAVLDTASARMEKKFARTKVTFRSLSDEEIEIYLSNTDPYDKAGGYTLTGPGTLLVTKVEGCYYNVLGLPMIVLDELLRKFGVSLFDVLQTEGAAVA